MAASSRLRWFQPYKTIFENGVIVGGGSDHMQKIGSLRSVNPSHPFLGMWVALTRQPRWMDTPLHPEQKITREQVIRLYTINNAYLTFEEKEKGSIETREHFYAMSQSRNPPTTALATARAVAC